MPKVKTCTCYLRHFYNSYHRLASKFGWLCICAGHIIRSWIVEAFLEWWTDPERGMHNWIAPVHTIQCKSSGFGYPDFPDGFCLLMRWKNISFVACSILPTCNQVHLPIIWLFCPSDENFYPETSSSCFPRSFCQHKCRLVSWSKYLIEATQPQIFSSVTLPSEPFLLEIVILTENLLIVIWSNYGVITFLRILSAK